MANIAQILQQWRHQIRYQPVAEDKDVRPSRYSTASVVLLTTVVAVLCSAALSITVYLTLTTLKTDLVPGGVTHCGNSSTTAIARGCKFDIISFSWLPPACYDADLVAEFEQYRNWTWYEDVQGKRPVPKSEVVRGERESVHVYWDYHLVHCTFMWKKMHRALARGGWVDSLIADYEHTRHCGDMFFMPGIPEGDLHATIYTKYPYCTSKKVFT
ncbi:hypothetical protein GE09DRAFT_1216984 [Coniochaeta sp. 2T2.1]|nr:hypothetical protein GE09DRAFT_1216984 [Coniochaeta sp. 2T2.1]